MGKDALASGVSAREVGFSTRRIAGVVPINVGDNLPFRFHAERAMSVLQFTRDRYAQKRVQNQVSHIGFYETGMAQKTAYLRQSITLEQTFLATASLLDDIATASSETAGNLTENQLLRLALANTDGAVDPDFSPTALNRLNASFFGTPFAFADKIGPAQWFVVDEPINVGMGAILVSHINKRNIRIKELSTGRRAKSWPIIAGSQPGISMDVTLTDFHEPDISTDVSLPANLTLSRGRHNLLTDRFERLVDANRYDAIMATYGFDSVWLPDDITLTKFDDIWYRHLYRIKVADWHPKRESVVQALREGQPLEDVRDFNGVFIEQALEGYDINASVYKKYLQKHYTAGNGGTIAIPGGFVTTVIDAFDKQLSANGIMMIGDVSQEDGDNVLHTSGAVARYKSDNYAIAKQILEDRGFVVELLFPEDINRKYLRDAREQIEMDKSQVVMVVRRR